MIVVSSVAIIVCAVLAGTFVAFSINFLINIALESVYLGKKLSRDASDV